MAKNIILVLPVAAAKDIIVLASYELDLYQTLLRRAPHMVDYKRDPGRIRRLDELKRVLEAAVERESAKTDDPH